MCIHTCIYVYTYIHLSIISIYIYIYILWICIHCVYVEYYLYSPPGVFFSSRSFHNDLLCFRRRCQSAACLRPRNRGEKLHDSPGMRDGPWMKWSCTEPYQIAIWVWTWKCWVNIPNEIAIFHRDNDQQNHWVQWGLAYFQTHPYAEITSVLFRTLETTLA